MTQRPKLSDLPAVSPSKLAHIVLRSRDTAAAKAWWMKVLNARDIMEGAPGAEGSGAAGMTYDHEHHRVLILPMAPRDAEALRGKESYEVADMCERLPGLQHVAFTFGSIAELLSTYKRLAGEGIYPAMCVNHGGTLSMYYNDPDGNNVELLLDTMPMDLAFEFMHSEAFSENVVGYPWDPEEFCERFEAGAPLKELFSYGWAALA